MSDIKMLQQKIDESGMTITFIAEKAGIVRETLYNRMKGVGEFTASEIVGLSKVLKLSAKERNHIFLNEKLN